MRKGNPPSLKLRRGEGKIKKELRSYASAGRKKSNGWFFKTGKGQYGEGDKFIGVTNPNVRKVAGSFKDIPLLELQKLISSKIHEDRLCALFILVNRNKKADLRERRKILKFYLKNLKFVNNWDLVDSSAHYILGQAILDGIQNKKILDKLVTSKVLWERRVAIIATMRFVDKGKISDTLRLSKNLLDDTEDLIHKAVGWMLRESWKKEPVKVEGFLKANYSKLPRTTLRYAIERIEEKKRKRFLKGVF